MKAYQLVVEFAVTGIADIERMFECELKLHEQLRSGEVDGNDIGGDIFNFFIITQEPIKSFEETLLHLAAMNLRPNSAGYRGEDEDEYTRLWPKDDTTPFELR